MLLAVLQSSAASQFDFETELSGPVGLLSLVVLIDSNIEAVPALNKSDNPAHQG